MDKIHYQDLHDITRKHHNMEDKNILIKIITSTLSKMALIYCLALQKVADILNFSHNVISKVFIYHTTMSGIGLPENLMVDTKIINLLQLCQK